MKVLNIGCGIRNPLKLHAVFRHPDWTEVRLDIDEDVAPDIVGSMTDMHASISDQSFDAVWSSHNLEHLYAHEVPAAIAEFHRVLKQDAFALINCPDLVSIAELIVRGVVDQPAYMSAAGPITPLDMIFGHSRSIAGGNIYMSHNTGFTDHTLGRLLLEGGFAEAWVRKGSSFDVWAVAIKTECDRTRLRSFLAAGGLDFSENSLI